MKKYVKPELFYERYELSTHIAACHYDLNLERENCAGTGYSDPDVPGIFIAESGVDGCQAVVEDYCYTTGAGDRNTFAS